MFQQELAPLGNLTVSSLVGLLPLLTIFVLLGALRWKAQWAGLTALAVAIVVAVTAFGMPVGLAVLAGTQGAVFGLFPIMWIVFNAIWLYQVTVVSGRFEDLRAAFHLISDDPRVQAIIIAFCFGGLLEALAGFGAPVAITGVMLMALGFSAVRAAVVVLLANTAPVAFGAIGTPIITAGTLTGIPYTEIGAYVGRQTPHPGVHRARCCWCCWSTAYAGSARPGRWPWSVGVTFAIVQFLSSNYLSVELTDIIAVAGRSGRRGGRSCGSGPRRAARRPAAKLHREHEAELSASQDGHTSPSSGGVQTRQEQHLALVDRAEGLTRGRIFMAFFPYLLVIVVFSLAKLWAPVKHASPRRTSRCRGPGSTATSSTPPASR